MRPLRLRSVRARLWTTLLLLSLAVLGVSGLSWISLQRVDTRLQELHQQSLIRVAQAIDLSKRSSDLATSAPYLLSQRSNFLIKQEGNKLINVLEEVRENWPSSPPDENDKTLAVAPITENMERGIRDLIGASQRLESVQSDVRRAIAILGRLRETAIARIEKPAFDDDRQVIWWTLHSMNVDALNAAYANNLIGVGEEQRHYQRQRRRIASDQLRDEQSKFVSDLEQITIGEYGIFELRRKELAANLDAQNALFRIRRDANRVNELAVRYASRAEAFLAAERDASSSTIQFTRLSVAAISLISLALALTAALFVSRYVAHNIGRVSQAMVQLANGDRTSMLPRTLGGDDEIGDLFRSFRSFRANALRLDRSHRLLNQRNALFEKVFANISYGIVITDPSGRITAANPAFSHILSLDDQDWVQKSFVERLLMGKFAASVKSSGLSASLRGQVELEARDGQILELRASRLPDDGRVWLIADITQSRKMSDRIQHIDRIETLGQSGRRYRP